MSFFASGFDASKIEPATAMAPLPDGDYRVIIHAATEKPTKKAGGIGLNLQYKVIDEGKYKGRTLFHWINLRNENQTAAEIGARELSALCRAIGIMKPTSPSQFTNKTIKVSVKVEKDRDGNLTNRIAGILLPVAAATAAPADPSLPPVADEAAPWG